ncbi:MAG: radical SAM protein [Nanoarchaeota archaeon]
MVEFSYEELEFVETVDEILVLFMKLYRFSIKKGDLSAIGPYQITKHSIEINAPERSANTKFNRLLSDGFSGMVGPNNKKTVYVHKGLGVPLIGSNVIGIVDRDTNVIEVKPLTGCNLNCTFCSVDEGVSSRKTQDFIIEEQFLVEEFAKVARLKKYPLEAHIAGHSEPTLYPWLLELVRDLRKISRVKDVAIDTNGTLLTEAALEQLISAGLTRVDLSIHAMDKELARKLAGTAYDLGQILTLARFLARKKCLLLTPVYLPGINDAEIEKLIIFSKELCCPIGIQNFLPYDQGRNPVKGIGMDAFFEKLSQWEKKYCVDLRLKDVFSFQKDKVLEKPFRKGDKVIAQVVFPGKYFQEIVVMAKGRLITVRGFSKRVAAGERVKVRIVRDKHNVFLGVIP